MVVSGRFRARPNEVNAGAVSPRPWRSIRMFGGAGESDRVEGGGVMVIVR